MTKSRKILLLTICLLLSGFITYLLLPPHPPLSPLAPNVAPQSEVGSADHDYLIIGFLPYWNLKKLTPEATSSITHLAYFTLHLDGTGNLVKLVNSREEDPGYTSYKRILSERSKSKNNYHNLILTFMPFDQDALSSLLMNSSNRQQAITTIKDLLTASEAVGVNIDFEPLGSIPPSLRDSFTLFIQELSSQLSNLNPASPAGGSQLSVSIYPSAASRPRLWDLALLSKFTDYFVVMTYDYTLPGDVKAGPNAPLRGAGNLFEHDILTNLAELTAIIPPNQILLGIPFYGYEWEAESSEKYIPTTTRGAVASLERIQELIDDNTLELLWDRNSLTPYAIRWEEGEIISQIYFESLDSIKLKLALVKSADLGGIAIWALGYEGDNPKLWSLIRSLNTP